MIQNMLETIGQKFPLTRRDVGEFAQMKVSGMKFTVKAYEAKGLGSVSVMTAKGFCGLMQMDTLIITPTQVDMPLLSYDRVLAMGNDTLIFELYDTLLGPCDLSELEVVHRRTANLPDHDLGSHWYDSIKLPQSLSKKGKKKNRADFDRAVRKYVEVFLSEAGVATKCEAAPKREKAAVYVEGLLKHGGPSTDVFKKGIGEEKTATLFRKILFATGE